MVTAGRQLRVLHVVNDANAGGAQTLIERLGAHAHPDWEPHLLVLLGPGALAPRLEKHFVSVTYLGFETRSWRLDQLVWSVSRACRAIDPDVVHSHLLQSDLAVALGRRWKRDLVEVSSIHTMGYSFGDPWRTRVVSRLMGTLAHRFDATVACTPQAMSYMRVRGYPRSRSTTITNGVPVADVPAPAERAPQLVVLARWHTVKDYPTLLAAFAQVHRELPEARLVCAGVGVDEHNAALVRLVREYRLDGAVQLRGPLDDVDPVLRESRALVISSAYGEALPMAGIEALAVGTPVLTTEVGDTPSLVVEGWQCVPPSRPERLAEAMRRLLQLDQDRFADLARDSHRLARERFDIATTVAAYHDLYQRLRGRRA